MHIELIATDGTTQKRILWVDVTSNSVCSGMCKEKTDLHTTYHFDGNVFSNMFGEKPKKMYAVQPLEDLRGRHQLSCMVFTSDPARLHDTRALVFKIDVSGSNLSMVMNTPANMSISENITINGQEHLEYGTCRLVDADYQGSVSYRYGEQTSTQIVITEMKLVKHVKP